MVSAGFYRTGWRASALPPGPETLPLWTWGAVQVTGGSPTKPRVLSGRTFCWANVGWDQHARSAEKSKRTFTAHEFEKHWSLFKLLIKTLLK